ncbi:MAG: tRNA (adenosine(37)-N6)-threonylcarbamoyltransferase complex dimerization subunit type 1 TsaB [Candidatus Babeliales bacterium]|jgi:tRNA threonylcarbamoyladenosine biosynthesis protein TsaB
MKPVFLSIQATYAHVHLALFTKSVCSVRLSSTQSRASSHLIPLCISLLDKQNLRLQDLDFIAIDKGPGAFTSLRVALATVNGIAFAHHLPLIGIDSLDAFTHDITTQITAHTIPAYRYILVLLNAYNNDVYYCLSCFNTTTKNYESCTKGCGKIDAVLAMIIKEFAPKELIGTGNGCTQHLDLITSLTKEIHFYHHDQALPTVDSIGALGLQQFSTQASPCYKIEPNYLKSQYFAIAQHPEQKKNS